MGLKPDQERVKLLLKDTMMLLCKNGLEFNAKFRIEALIGVTLDDDNVFLMNFDEMMKSEKCISESPELSDDPAGSNKRSHDSPRPRKRRRRNNSKPEVHSIDSDSGDNDGGGADDDVVSDQISGNTSRLVTRSKKSSEGTDIKTDIMFVKEEGTNEWNKVEDEASPLEYPNFSSSQTPDNSFPLSEMTLVPTGSQETQGEIDKSIQEAGMEPSTSAAGLWQGDNGQPEQPSQEHISQQDAVPLTYAYCGKQLSSKLRKNKHDKVHQIRSDFKSTQCSKEFLTRSQLQEHTDMHRGSKKFACSICTDRFFNRMELLRHKRTKHPLSQAHALATDGH